MIIFNTWPLLGHLLLFLTQSYDIKLIMCTIMLLSPSSKRMGFFAWHNRYSLSNPKGSIPLKSLARVPCVFLYTMRRIFESHFIWSYGSSDSQASAFIRATGKRASCWETLVSWGGMECIEFAFLISSQGMLSCWSRDYAVRATVQMTLRYIKYWNW